MSDLFKKALYFSAEKHDGQYRKGRNVPYIVHPVMVAFGVSKYSDDEEIIAAALLHDVLEDCPTVSLDVLNKEFGSRVSNIVFELSFLDKSKNFTWREKKEAYLYKIKNASKDTLIIFAVDKMDNLKGYFGALKNKPELLVGNFKGSPEEYSWYYREIGRILDSYLGNHPVVKDYHSILSDYQI